MDGQVKLSRYSYLSDVSDRTDQCCVMERGVERMGKGAGGGCVGDRGAVGAVSSTIEFALLNDILALRDTYNNQHTEIA